eukprot:TRINITY_DN12382_c0_g1_i1.p1 TRINITY_DN12382_c0_g1~~TRINITY_DN12382_c0_g1_i1.p1  ORF type:complete len:288 (+),score=121.16 TRINITY_DN12382_c0_g1_i1:47-910(+)
MAKHLTIIGKFNETQYHKARVAAQEVEQSNAGKVTVKLVALKPFEFDLHLENVLNPKYAEELRVHRERSAKMRQSVSPVVLDGENWIGGIDEFLRYLQINYNYADTRPFPLYKALGSSAFKEFLDASKHTYFYLDISVGGTAAGRLIIELNEAACPKTVGNFVGLAAKYKDSPVHRIVPGGWIQAGDISGGHGDGGESTFGGVFADENFIVKHDKAGIVGMANRGPHTNTSQFYVTLAPTPWMDTTFVAFGELFDGHSVLKHLESLPTENERPNDVTISGAGRFQLE